MLLDPVPNDDFDGLFWKELPILAIAISRREIGTNQIAMNSLPVSLSLSDNF